MGYREQVAEPLELCLEWIEGDRAAVRLVIRSQSGEVSPRAVVVALGGGLAAPF